jgi:hypothetical protein
MNKLLQQTMWLQGSPRQFLGPQVGALVPLNILAAAFTHSHSDVSMRILHGYSDLGLIFGAFGSVVLLILQSDMHGKLIFSLLLIANIALFIVNTWITIKGMGVPYGSQFHLMLAVIFCANFYLTSRTHRKFSNLK